ncbi:MAG TPA: alpha-amylase family glycosyl hydrolase [Candidatus Saccharimonadales bacterium]|nr:alpha-amylase family glycosyl hydrolase [Candidatus Saccharimonadales bacterium]
MGGAYKKDVGVAVLRSGVKFRVWAPFADSVAVTGTFNDWGETPLASERDGYWSGKVASAVPGQEYKFVIHRGGDTFYRNDPRALHFTISAGSSVISSTDFDWGDDHFTPIPFNQQVIYELHVGTFNRPDAATNGTFQDVIAKLDHLAALGVNMIELMPICSMLMDRGWGYAIDYIYAVESLYGGRYGFLQFVKAAHERGIGIILDVVYNHFGPDEKLDLWCFDGWQKDGMGGIYFYNDWRAETPWGKTRPDFGRNEVQQYILDNVRMWLHDCRVDGLRVDSTIFIRNVKGHNDSPSTDLAEGWQLLQGITDLSKKLKPTAITIAEDVAANDYITKPIDQGGAGFSAQWELGFPQSLREALCSHDPAGVNLTGLCGELGRRYNDDALQRIVYADSHDTAANGSARLNEAVAPGKSSSLFARQQSLIAAALVLTAPGIPMLCQGQEFMQGGSFNDWQGLDWNRAEVYDGIVQAYRQLIALRQNKLGVTAGLTGQSVNLFHVDEGNKVLAYHRWANGGPTDDVVVIVNFTDHEYPVYYLNFPRNGTWHVRFNSTNIAYSPDFTDQDVPDIEVKAGGANLVLPARCALILSQD